MPWRTPNCSNASMSTARTASSNWWSKIDKDNFLYICCPTCRQSILLPPAIGVSGLQSAFHIHHLMDIQEILEKVKVPKKVQCEKCKKLWFATKFCQDCRKFVCEKCIKMYCEWDEFLNHEVVGMEQINMKQLVPPKKKVNLYCSSRHLHSKHPANQLYNESTKVDSIISSRT